MTNMIIDPIQGLIDYVLDIKPYHTKVVEVLVDNVGFDIANTIIREDNQLGIEAVYTDSNFDIVPCHDGYGMVPFGDGRKFVVMSPNPGISFEHYPAIDPGTNTFIVLGDQTPNIQVGDQLFLGTHIEDIIIGATAGYGSPMGTFTVYGNQTNTYVPGFIFGVVNSGSNNGNYSVVSSSLVSGNTVIRVSQPVTTSNNGGFIRYPSNNIGTYTVTALEYSGGTIDSWPDLADASSYKIGDGPYTKVTVQQPLSALPTLTTNQTYTAVATSDAVEVIAAFSYSHFIRQYNPYIQAPDEGTATYTIRGAIASTLNSSNQAISNSGSFTIDGDLSGSNLFIGDPIVVTQTTDNNGTYTITSINYSATTHQTTIGVAERITSSVASGVLTIAIPSNVFVVSGNKQARFIPGTLFTIAGGSKVGTYTTLSSRFIPAKNVTWIRTVERIFDQVGGAPITSVQVGVGSPLVSYFVVQGSQAPLFATGTKFNVIGSLSNDGQYTVLAPGAHSSNGSTFIPVSGTIDSRAGGEIHEFAAGYVKYFPYGYGQHSDICRYIPGTHAHVVIGEQLFFSGGNIRLKDNIIAYDLENSDSWGYDLPLLTVFSSTAPTVTVMSEYPSNPSRPSGSWPNPRPNTTFPQQGAIWFDTTAHVMKQYTGNTYTESLNEWQWTTVPRLYWYNTTDSSLHYRVVQGMGSPQDTGWVLDYSIAPGFSGVIAAVGKKAIATTNYFSGDVFHGSTFTLSTAVPSVEYLRVTVNDVPAEITLNTSTSFTIVSPVVNPSDDIVAEIYQDGVIQTNAYVSHARVSQTLLNVHVTSIQIPYTPSSNTSSSSNIYIPSSEILIDTIRNFFSITGGNFAARFSPTASFTGIDDATGTVYGPWVASTIIASSVGPSTVTVTGNLTWLFAPNAVFEMVHASSLTTEYVVLSSTFDGTHTTITTKTPLIEHTTGYIYGAVFDGQNTTIVIPSTAIVTSITGVLFPRSWDGVTGPLRIDTGLLPTDLSRASVLEKYGISDEVVGSVTTYPIVSTNASANTFAIHYTDPATGAAVDLTSSFIPGHIFSVLGSYAGTLSTSVQTNDAKYVVASSYFDKNGTGNTIITIDTNYNNIPPFNSYSVVSMTTGTTNTITLQGDHVNVLKAFTSRQFKFSQPIISATPIDNVITAIDIQLVNGNTVISFSGSVANSSYTGPIGIIENSYSADIIYDPTNVVGGWTHGYIPSDVMVTSSGAINVTSTTINDKLSFGWGSFYEWPIVSIVANTIYVSGDLSSVAHPNEKCSIVGSYGYDGAHQVVSATYSAITGKTAIVVAFPSIPTVSGSPANYGRLRLEQIDITGWFQFLIRELNANSGTITVNGNASTYVQVGQQFAVTGTLNNNKIFTVRSSPTFDATTTTTTIPVAEPIAFGTANITTVVNYNTIRVQGNVAQYLSGSDLVYITGSASNNGMYLVSGSSYDTVANTTTIVLQIGSPGLSLVADGVLEFYQRGGWIESWKFMGMSINLVDKLAIGIHENADAIVLTSVGSPPTYAFDYPLWNKTGYDALIGTTIHLYTGTYLGDTSPAIQPLIHYTVFTPAMDPARWWVMNGGNGVYVTYDYQVFSNTGNYIRDILYSIVYDGSGSTVQINPTNAVWTGDTWLSTALDQNASTGDRYCIVQSTDNWATYSIVGATPYQRFIPNTYIIPSQLSWVNNMLVLTGMTSLIGPTTNADTFYVSSDHGQTWTNIHVNWKYGTTGYQQLSQLTYNSTFHMYFMVGVTSAGETVLLASPTLTSDTWSVIYDNTIAVNGRLMSNGLQDGTFQMVKLTTNLGHTSFFVANAGNWPSSPSSYIARIDSIVNTNGEISATFTFTAGASIAMLGTPPVTVIDAEPAGPAVTRTADGWAYQFFNAYFDAVQGYSYGFLAKTQDFVNWIFVKDWLVQPYDYFGFEGGAITQDTLGVKHQQFGMMVIHS